MKDGRELGELRTPPVAMLRDSTALGSRQRTDHLQSKRTDYLGTRMAPVVEQYRTLFFYRSGLARILQPPVVTTCEAGFVVTWHTQHTTSTTTLSNYGPRRGCPSLGAPQ